MGRQKKNGGRRRGGELKKPVFETGADNLVRDTAAHRTTKVEGAGPEEKGTEGVGGAGEIQIRV